MTNDRADDSSNVTSASTPQKLSFKVSSGLKRVLGRELITNDEVAIFELVKNSFDAGADNVFLDFNDGKIAVIDDGSGMSYDDLANKWLFVAYSAKRGTARDGTDNDFRQESSERRQFAGSKGVGRFSSDRLGQHLTLQTRHASECSGPVHRVDIHWPDFEANDQDLFSTISVEYSTTSSFDMPDSVPDLEHGTVIVISQLQKQWSRDELLKLKRGLSKLINPFGASVDGFHVRIRADQEKDRDDLAKTRYQRATGGNLEDAPDLVNGVVGNFIFTTLREKTTFLEVEISSDGSTLQSRLIDRGELIYEICETSEYPLLAGAGFRCELYYLNQSAKSTFTRRMGLEPVRFGSVFLFRNGFRVVPSGDPGDDWLSVDRRKQQGYARFLGTRDVIGRIDISGNDIAFQEASSRNQGLIETPSVLELKECFREHCLKRLERYVVPVSWAKEATADKLTDNLSIIETDAGRARVSAAVASLVGSEAVTLIRYSNRLIDTINERSSQFESSLAALKVIALTTGDSALATKIGQAETRFIELKRSEEEARRRADEERLAKEKAEAEAEAAKDALVEERKRNLFLASVSSLDFDTIVSLHHSITIYAQDLSQQIENFLLRIGNKTSISRSEVLTAVEPIALLNMRVLAIAKFATKANFRIDSEFIEEDLHSYLRSYIEEIATKFISSDAIALKVTSDGKVFTRKFKPIDVSIVVDNFISNASKAGASEIAFTLKQPTKSVLEVMVQDNGCGLKLPFAESSRVFEKGYSTTDGSGLGLYHVRQVLGEMQASVEVLPIEARGTRFLMRIPL